MAKQGSKYFVGDNVTLADILFYRIFALLFNFGLGASQRASLPALTAWYERVYRDPLFTGVAGNFHMTAEAWKLCGSDKTINFAGAAVEEVKKAAEEEDDMDDLFGSDDDDDQDARMEAKAKAIAAAKGAQKPKKEIIAKSLILFEVKPLDDETDLDALAVRIQKEI